MDVLIKQGVYGELVPEAAEGKRQIEKLFNQHNEDLIITSIREGTHSPGSFHPNGRAFDIRTPKEVSINEIRNRLNVNGHKFDVVEHSTHIHIEYDPKS